MHPMPDPVLPRLTGDEVGSSWCVFFSHQKKGSRADDYQISPGSFNSLLLFPSRVLPFLTDDSLSNCTLYPNRPFQEPPFLTSCTHKGLHFQMKELSNQGTSKDLHVQKNFTFKDLHCQRPDPTTSVFSASPSTSQAVSTVAIADFARRLFEATLGVPLLLCRKPQAAAKSK